MKIKFPILFKIALLGILVTGLASGGLLAISAVNQNKENETALLKAIDTTLLSIEQDYEQGEAKEELQNALGNVKDYFNTIRASVPSLDTTSQADYQSFKEYKQFIKESFPWIYPLSGSVIGASLPSQIFKSHYRNLTLMLQNACLNSGGKYAYMGYYDTTGGFTDLIFLNDSRLDEYDSSDEYYHLPGSHIAESLVAPTKGSGSLEIEGKMTRYVALRSNANETTVLAYLFIEYDFAGTSEKTARYLQTSFSIIAIILAASVLVYMLLAYLFIIRNLKKLTIATDSISNDLKNKKPVEGNKLTLKTRDEFGLLASSFGLMQDEIVNYTNIIQEEAKENERRAAELDVASKIQLNALPGGSYCDQAIDLQAFIQPAKVVGGDFYDYFYTNGNLAFVIADVSGKGVPASLLMMKAKALIKSKLLGGLSLKDAVKEANIELNENNTESLFVTAFIGVYDQQKSELRFVNAGHVKPYIYHQGEWRRLQADSNYVLGVVDDVGFLEEKVAFEKGDIFFGFTDGLNESINKEDEAFGDERIETVLSQNEGKHVKELIAVLHQSHLGFIQNEEQFDDITMLAFQAHCQQLHLAYDQKDFVIIEDATDKFYAQYPYLDEGIKAHVGIVLDELLNNLISYENREDLTINLDFEYSNDELRLTIVSNGEDFNPFTHSSKANKDKLGGHGINLVKTLTKKQHYEYKNNKSVIALLF